MEMTGLDPDGDRIIEMAMVVTNSGAGYSTCRSLEITRTMREGRREGSLLAVLDRTVTAMGTRLLREWLLRPLVNSAAIEARLTAVDELKRQIDARVRLRTALRTVQDISRLCSRMSLGVANPRDVLALKLSLSSLPALSRHGHTCRGSRLIAHLP